VTGRRFQPVSRIKEKAMELSPTDARLESIGDIDLLKTDEKYDFKLTPILRKRQRPLLMLIDRDANLLYASVPPAVNGAVRHAEIRAKLGAKTRTAIVSIVHGLHPEGINGAG
jgi:hypothetical protein